MQLHDLTVPVYIQMLGTLSGLVVKAADSGNAEALFAARLAPDMFPLATQIRFTCGQAGEAVQRLTGKAFTAPAEDDATPSAAKARIAATLAYLEQATPDGFADPELPVELALPNGMTFGMTAEQYVRDWAMPQFYFHLVSAYAILRQQGVPIGKADYVPYMARYLVSGPALG
jgi:hypothetical protein